MEGGGMNPITANLQAETTVDLLNQQPAEYPTGYSEPWPTPVFKVSDAPRINSREWEAHYGEGQALSIDELISKLQAVRKLEGNLPCNFRNYDEENVIAPVTNTTVDHGCIVFESQDVPIGERI
jgi:hypothetical protein